VKIWQVVAIVLMVLFTLHITGNCLSRGNIPASCQVLGGHWSVLYGWRCG
jgi:hypothetical protein